MRILMDSTDRSRPRGESVRVSPCWIDVHPTNGLLRIRPESGRAYEILRENIVVENVQRWFDARVADARGKGADGWIPVSSRAQFSAFVLLRREDPALAGLSPYNGSLVVVFERIYAPPGAGMPAPFVVPGGTRKTRDGRTYEVEDRPYWRAIFRVIEHPINPRAYVGLESGVRLPFWLFMDAAGLLGVVHSRSREGTRLLDLISAAGLLDVEVPYSENPLPDLERVLRERGRPVLAQFENGFIERFAPLPEDEG